MSVPDLEGDDTKPDLARLREDVGLVIAAWLLSIGIDFLLHAGLLARLYVRESPFLLPAEAAFARIPLGYASFLILTVGLWWLIGSTKVAGAARGLRVGLVSGMVVWGALSLGLFSISSAPADLLGGWWAGQALELGAAGAVLGAGRAEGRRRGLYGIVAVTILACLVVTIALQILGWAPAMQMAP